MKLSNFTKKFGIVFVLIGMIVFFAILAENFFTVKNALNVARQISMMGIAGVGATVVLIAGGLDLSIGAQIAIMNVATGMMLVAGVPVPIAVILGILINGAIGFTNGFVITKAKIPSFIATLGMMTALRGLAYILCDGYPIYEIPDSIRFIGQGYILDIIPVPVIIMVIVIIFGAILLNKTYIGRYFYALGNNEEATRLSGINVGRVRMLSYTIQGLLVGVAGLVMLGRVASAQPSIGSGFELDVITAVVLGGVSVNGGKGSVGLAIIGVIIIGVLSNGMAVAGINDYYQQLIKGIVLLLVMIIDSVRMQKQKAALN